MLVACEVRRYSLRAKLWAGQYLHIPMKPPQTLSLCHRHHHHCHGLWWQYRKPFVLECLAVRRNQSGQLSIVWKLHVFMFLQPTDNLLSRKLVTFEFDDDVMCQVWYVCIVNWIIMWRFISENWFSSTVYICLFSSPLLSGLGNCSTNERVEQKVERSLINDAVVCIFCVVAMCCAFSFTFQNNFRILWVIIENVKIGTVVGVWKLSKFGIALCAPFPI